MATAVGAGLLSILAIALFSSSALALQTHPNTGVSFGPEGAGSAATFSGVKSVALDPSSGDVFVVDGGGGSPGKIYKLDANGEPVKFGELPGNTIETGIVNSAGEVEVAVAPAGASGGTAGDIYLATNFKVEVFSPGGKKLTELTGPEPCGVAVRPNGNVVIGEYPETIREFAPKQNPVAAADQVGPDRNPSGLQGICNVAVDNTGGIYAAFYGGSADFKLESIGDPSAESVFATAPGRTLAVDTGTQDVYVDTDTEFVQYSSSGALVSRSAGGEIEGSAGIAAAPSGVKVYVSTGRGRVAIYGALATLPDATTEAVSGLTEMTAVLNATVNPQSTATTYQFQYGTTRNYGSTAPAAPAPVGSDSTDHKVSVELTGLTPETEYHFRVNATNSNGTSHGGDIVFKTPGPLVVETTGSPERTATSVRFDSRVFVHGIPTTYHFEYGMGGPCGPNLCASTPVQPAGSEFAIELVSQSVGGLAPGTTYHYRVVADDGTSKSPAYGADMTVTTRSDDARLSHFGFPGPPGSDRAWEQVNQPEINGSPVGALGGSNLAVHIAESGERLIYPIRGGTPEEDTGSNFSLIYSERSPTGWRVRKITPPRSLLTNGNWPQQTVTTPDLSTIFSANFEYTTEEASMWEISPDRSPRKLFEVQPKGGPEGSRYGVDLGLSEDGSRMVALLSGYADPAYGSIGSNIYDLGSGSPRLLGILPDGSVCSGAEPADPGNVGAQLARWISPDGARVFFNCGGGPLYARIPAEGKTVRIGSGCGRTTLIQSFSDEAFFATPAGLTSEDTSECGNVDVYRVQYASGQVSCVTCVAGEKVEVRLGLEPAQTTALSEDRSRLYFTNQGQLLPGASSEFGIYRLDLRSGSLAYVAPGLVQNGLETTPDGQTLVFASQNPGLNARNGQDNGGTAQFYRYSDRDRSLTCISCPPDGSPVAGEAQVPFFIGATRSSSNDGNTIAFITPTSLVSDDQNTAGPGQPLLVGDDVYEWRDGRRLLVTDGLTEASYKYLSNGSIESQRPTLAGVDQSGRDIFFYQPVQYTPDALDTGQRLYDARLGGGFEYPPPPKPCPLEVCQGTPKGTPEELPPGTSHFSGPGNKKAHKKHKKHHKHHQRKHRKGDSAAKQNGHQRDHKKDGRAVR